MDELDELIKEQVKEIVKNIPIKSPFPIPKQTPQTDPNTPQPQYMKQKIEFSCILAVTIYPNGQIATRVTRPLQPKFQFAPKKKVMKKPTIKFEGAKKETLDLG